MSDSSSIDRLTSPSGLSANFNDNGSLRELRWGPQLCVHLFPGNGLEAGNTQLVLRRWPGDTEAGKPQAMPLFGPGSPSRWQLAPEGFRAWGRWDGLAYELRLRLAASEPVWFWQVDLRLDDDAPPCTVDLLLQHDIALAPHGALRLNEYYVSHYVDFTPLEHPIHGCMLAVRQNQPASGRHPWALIGSLRHAVSFATDAMQVLGLGHRVGDAPLAWQQGLPGQRLQQEQAMAALQEAPVRLQPGQADTLGFFGGLVADHPGASSTQDLALLDGWLALPEARLQPATGQAPGRAADEGRPSVPSLFQRAPHLAARALSPDECDALFGSQRRHAERGPDGALWSFFAAHGEHVVLPGKERAVLRPHGHLLRSGEHLVPDESAMTSTCWMGGVFHSMITQGHVSLNRFVSTVHGTLGQFQSQGLRVFVDLPGHGGWQMLALPSAFAMSIRRARWWYRHAAGLIEVEAAASPDSPDLTLRLRTVEGPECACLVTMHLALNGDDGEVPGRIEPQFDGDGGFRLAPAPGSALHQRFPDGGFHVAPLGAASLFVKVSGAEVLFEDGQHRNLPMLCLHLASAPEAGLTIRGELIPPVATPAPHLPSLAAPHLDGAQGAADALSTVLPWYQHNALVHYLAPRGLEQYSGGGWGTRDVCQGPVELLLAQGSHAPVRDLLLRVFSAQDPGGDWPQWFMFFERDAAIRAGDSHGDIVFWPLLALGQYLAATGDAALLDVTVPFHTDGEAAPASGTVWQHAERALAVIGARRIAGTSLAAYGHGDWNDSLQPADPRLREHLCSAWTVTLHAQVLDTLAQALEIIGRPGQAEALRDERSVVQADFHHWLMPGGVVGGYALFGAQPVPDILLHPQDAQTGVHYSLLPMIHAILADLFTPDQAATHLALIREHLLGPDGARLFDAPFAYRGGPQVLFQRAESSSYFGREIGLMYTHAHLRYAEALAHAGRAEAFWRALQQAHPVAMQQRVPSAAPRQANCYYSSSDAAFADRAQANLHYADALAGRVPLEGGWRVYSSGAGIALGLVQRCLLGLRPRADACVIDPVMPTTLNGLHAHTMLAGRAVDIDYEVGPQGHGPLAIELNGHRLRQAVEPNPYRPGGARIAWAEMTPHWSAVGGNRLLVAIG